MNRLRFWFLLPARVWFAVLFFAPLAIICAYSLLARGDYGGVERPWNLENYRRSDTLSCSGRRRIRMGSEEGFRKPSQAWCWICGGVDRIRRSPFQSRFLIPVMQSTKSVS